MTLGSVTATAIIVEAEGSILDGNGASVNLTANVARLIADRNGNNTGSIGDSAVLNGTPDLNANAIDTNVTTIAAASAQGIYIEEADGLTVDATVI